MSEAKEKKRPEKTKAHAIHLVAPFREALYDPGDHDLGSVIKKVFAQDASVHLCHPFETLDVGALGERVYAQLTDAMPDLERRDLIVMAGHDPDGQLWVGCCGYYTGTFSRPFLDIPPSGHQASLRFHEFFRIVEDQVAELQAVWDLPELMMQAGVWPLSPSLGREWQVPGPARQDGLDYAARDSDEDAKSLKLVGDMLSGLARFASEGVQGMKLDQFWHPHFSWYGPSGIGTTRGISGFRNWHQIPFLNGMPDRISDPALGHLFADGPYAGFTGWPGMRMSLSGDGWLGIAPTGRQITMRSLDFWRCERGCIRENWVLIDLLHVYKQLGVDVLARMREITRSRYRA